MRRARSLAFALTLAFVLALPSVPADHVYSHRVVVAGRLVDAHGLPMPNVSVSVRFEGDVVRDACAEPQRPVTNAWGDFAFCWHKHALARDAVVRVDAANASESRALDTELRKMVFLLQDANASSGVAPEAWDASYRVEGRVWYRGAVELDGVQVEGIALVHVPVNVTVSGGLGNDTSYALLTGPYGDYEGSLSLDPQAASKLAVRVDTSGATFPVTLDPMFHRSVVDVRLPVMGESVITSAFGGQPGTRTPKADPMLVMGAVLAATISFAWVSRKR